MFFGRCSETQEIVQFLRGSQSVSIIGPLGIGKTSFLQQLTRSPAAVDLGIGKECLPGYIHCEALEGESSDGVFRQFASTLAAEMESLELSEEAELRKALASPSRLKFESSLRALNRRGLRIILLLDNFELLCANPRLELPFYNALRSMAGRFQLSFLTASTDPLVEFTFTGRPEEILSSPFFNIFASHHLGVLPKNEARDLIQTPARKFRRPFPPDLSDFIYQLAGGHPWFLQTACCHAWDCPGDRSAIEARTVQDLQPYLETIWQNLTPFEKQAALDPSGNALPGSDARPDEAVLRRLQHKSILVEENEEYFYSCSLWKDFLLQQSPG